MAPHRTLLLILTGLAGVHSITTISNVPVREGGSITIPCLYQFKYTRNVKYLCRGEYWASCSYEVKTGRTSDSNATVSGRFSISDNKFQKIFHVTIKDLRKTDAYFWCNVELDYGADDGNYFHLSVTSGLPGLYVDTQEIRGVIGGTISISCHHSPHGEIRWCKLGRSCVASHKGAIDGTNLTINNFHNVSIVSMIGLTDKSSGWYYCQKGDLQMPVHVIVTEKSNTSGTTGDQTQHSSLMGFIISLSLLIFIVPVALFIWFMLKKHQGKRSETSTIPEGEAGVVYSTVTHKRKAQPQRSCETDVDVLNSSEVFIRKPPARMVEAPDPDVTYSMLTVSQRNS